METGKFSLRNYFCNNAKRLENNNVFVQMDMEWIRDFLAMDVQDSLRRILLHENPTIKRMKTEDCFEIICIVITCYLNPYT